MRSPTELPRESSACAYHRPLILFGRVLPPFHAHLALSCSCSLPCKLKLWLTLVSSQLPRWFWPQVSLPWRGCQDTRDLQPEEYGRVPETTRWPLAQRSRCRDRAAVHLGSLVDVNGQVGAEVNYLGQKERFTSTQLVAMYLSKIKQITATETKLPVSDLVMSVPAWFTDVQRRSLIDAAEIAGLKLLRLMNDTTAAALGYGITKLDLPSADEKPKRVAFIDVGHSNYTCSIVEFKKGELAVKATAFDRHFGGRNFDKALVDHLHKEFLGKYKIDITTNPKAMTRVLAAAEKLKKILSANQQGPLNIESLMNDIDVRAMITRQEFEAMVEPVLSRVHVPLEQALADAKLTKDDIDVVEVVEAAAVSQL